MFSRFDTTPTCDGRTDGQTQGDIIYCASIYVASSGKMVHVTLTTVFSGVLFCHPQLRVAMINLLTKFEVSTVTG